MSSLDLCVVLVAPRNPLNIGAAARAMSNFGFSDLRLVNPYEVAFREAKSAVKAGHVIQAAREFPDLAAAVADRSLCVGTTSIGNRELQHPLRRLETAGTLIRRHKGRIAILFGSEKFGLSNEDMSHCQWLLRIPAREEHGSMNLGQAVAVTLYEVIRNARAAQAKPEAKAPATAEDRERITQFLLDALAQSGYLQPKTEATTRMKIRRLVRRMQLPATDVEMWFGMLRQILWKLGG